MGGYGERESGEEDSLLTLCHTTIMSQPYTVFFRLFFNQFDGGICGEKEWGGRQLTDTISHHYHVTAIKASTKIFGSHL